MPLSEFFADQFRQIKGFMGDPSEVVRIIRVDPDMRYVLIKALVKLEDEPDNPHLMLFADAAMTEPKAYFGALLAQLQRNYAENQAALRRIGVRFTVPDEGRGPLHPATEFRLYASALADALPDSLGSLVFVLDPEQIEDAAAFRQSVEFLARKVESNWLKFIVLDSRVSPRLGELETQVPRVGAQAFYMPPEAIEEKLRERVSKPAGSDPLQHRRSLGVLAGFAFGNKNYDEAGRLQREWAQLAESAGAPAEAAGASYNLGNTLLAQGDLLQAEDQFVRCCELCLAHAVNGVLPLALTNLGVTLFRQDRVTEAIESLRVAHRTFKAQNHRPGEAFVYDTLAGMYYGQQRLDEAEAAWLAALGVYEGITSDAFADLRESGSRDIRTKLERFYSETGRPNRMNGHQPPARGD
jgi:tetratricopeptide (TPR) repeat protein